MRSTREAGLCRTVALALVLGLALGLQHGSPAVARASGDRDVLLFAADRGADRVVALDADLIPCWALSVGAPSEIAAVPEGIWILRSLWRSARAPMQLVLVDRGGRVRACEEIGHGRRLVAMLDGGVALLRSDGQEDAERVWIVREEGSFALDAEQVAFLAADEELLALGERGGAITIRDLRGARVRARRAGGAELLGLERGQHPGQWIALYATGAGTRVEALDGHLRTLWARELALPLARPRCERGSGRIWLDCAERALVLALGGRGELVVLNDELALPGAEAALGAPEGGLWLIHPGALLALDPLGRPRPSQGGWQELVDLELSPWPRLVPSPGR